MTNSLDPDQTAPKEQSDLVLHCCLDQSIFILRFFRYTAF